MGAYSHEELRLAKLCLELQLKLWDTEAELEEELLGEDGEIDDMDETIQEFCAGIGSGGDISDEVAEELLDDLMDRDSC